MRISRYMTSDNNNSTTGASSSYQSIMTKEMINDFTSSIIIPSGLIKLRVCFLIGLFSIIHVGAIYCSNPATDHDLFIYEADHSYARVANPEFFPKDKYQDNVFHIVVDSIVSGTMEYYLEYSFKGVADAASISFSFNDRTSVGGYLISNDTVWHQHSEKISGKWLKNGNNKIQFSTLTGNHIPYEIKDVRIVRRSIDGQDVRLISTFFNGGYFESITYVRGVLTEVQAQDVTLFVDDIPVEIRGGGFELLVPLFKSNDFIELTLKDTVGNILYSEEIELDENFGMADLSFTMEERESANLSLPSTESNSLTVNGASIKVDSGILNSETLVVSLTSLESQDLAYTEMDLVNVTAKSAGFRFLPHGEHFPGKGALIGIPYSKRDIPTGYSASDIRIFYYDIKTSRWTALPVESIDRDKKVVYSRTTHF